MKRLSLILGGIAVVVSAILGMHYWWTSDTAGGLARRDANGASRGNAAGSPRGRSSAVAVSASASVPARSVSARHREQPPLRERFRELAAPPNGAPVNPQLVAALDPKAYFHERMAAIRRLDSRMSRAEIAAIGLFLLEPVENADPAQVDVPLNAIRNDLLEVLIRQKPAPPEELGELLAEVFHDRRHDVGWRDYAVQYFGHYLQAVAQFAPERRADAAAELREAYEEAMAETDGSIAGSALIGAEELSRTMPEFSRAWVAEKAFAVAADSSAGTAARTTAFQICALAGERRAVEPASLAAADSGMTAGLRASAIAALGQLAERTPEIELLLGDLAKPQPRGTDPRPAIAAQAALARLHHSITSGR